MKIEKWTAENYAQLVEILKVNADEKYKSFHSSLVPSMEKDSLLGVRMPKLRQLGKEIAKGNPRGFLAVCQSTYYEERMLRGIVTGLIKPKDYGDFLSLADSYLPYVSNWALCDCFCSGLKYVKKCRRDFFSHICDCYLTADNPWAVRVALVLMLNYYIDDEYIDEVLKRVDGVLKRVDGVHDGEYYVKMAQAWLIATAFAKCRDKTLEYFLRAKISDEVFNMAIQKAVESRRIDEDTKAYLRTLKKKR